MDNKFYKETIIEKKLGKLYEKKEIDTSKIEEEISLLKVEKERKVKEIETEFDVKINELKNILQ